MFRLPWIDALTPLPPPEQALQDPPGLLCAGAPVTPERLIEAYGNGIFPWFSGDQPPLWWSTDPRMVLHLDEFRWHPSLVKQIRTMARQQRWQLHLNREFADVMRACAAPRAGQDGTWIGPEIMRAYVGLHERKLAHSVEVWEGAHLIGGLYGVALGKMFFGESMFTRQPNASKVALAALVGLLKKQGFSIIDCQQETQHLSSMGARPLTRAAFLAKMRPLVAQEAPTWSTLSLTMDELALSTRAAHLN
jgi:leucyl/phenylalanyl-tRNA---protein transferase